MDETVEEKGEKEIEKMKKNNITEEQIEKVNSNEDSKFLFVHQLIFNIYLYF